MAKNSKKPELFCFVICDSVIKEERTGNANVMGIFNKISAPRFPAVHARLTVFTIWEWQKKKKRFFEKVRILGPENELVLEKNDIAVDFNEEAYRAYGVISFLNVRFATPGIYKVQLYFEGKIVRETALELIQVTS